MIHFNWKSVSCAQLALHAQSLIIIYGIAIAQVVVFASILSIIRSLLLFLTPPSSFRLSAPFLLSLTLSVTLLVALFFNLTIDSSSSIACSSYRSCSSISSLPTPHFSLSGILLILCLPLPQLLIIPSIAVLSLPILVISRSIDESK